MSARISSLPVVVSANIADTDILPIVTGIASNTGVTKRVSITELRLKLGTTAPAGGRTVTSISTYLDNNAKFNVKDFGAFGDGVTNDRTFIVNADAAAAVAHAALFFPPGNYKIDTDITMTAPAIQFADGAYISGAGTLIGNPTIPEVDARWFGLVLDGNVGTNAGTDNSAALRKAITFANNTTNRKVVRIPQGSGHCKLVTRVDIPSGVKLKGSGEYSTIVFAATGFSDASGLLQTVESGTGQPPGGVFDMAILAAAGVGAAAIGLNLNANASNANGIWVGGFIAANLRHGSTNQRSGPQLTIDQGGDATSIGILIESTGVQCLFPQIYAQQNGMVIQNLPTGVGKIPVIVTGAMVLGPVGSGTAFLISATNGMPVELLNCSGHSDNGSGYAAGVFRFTGSATNVRLENCRAEFGSAATGGTTTQTGFWIDGSSEVELHSPRTKRCRYGILIQSNNNRVFNQNHQSPVVDGLNIAAGVSGNLIDGGYITGAGGNGVSLIATAVSNYIMNLFALGNTGWGFDLAGDATTKNFFKNNQALANTAGAFRRTGTVANIIWSDNADASGNLGVTAAITTPTAPSAGYVQAEAASAKTAIDAIRAALITAGITL